jgi:hypothetical protein
MACRAVTSREGRKQKAESRRQKAEDRRQETPAVSGKEFEASAPADPMKRRALSWLLMALARRITHVYPNRERQPMTDCEITLRDDT